MTTSQLYLCGFVSSILDRVFFLFVVSPYIAKQYVPFFLPFLRPQNIKPKPFFFGYETPGGMPTNLLIATMSFAG